MAQTITFTSDQLQQLAAAVTATDLRNPQAERLARAGTEISLSFSRAEITHREPPLLQLPQRIVSLRILGREYRDSVQWTEVWRQISSGLAEGRQPVSISQVRTAQGQPLTDTVIVETATTATATLSVTSTQATAAPEITVGVVVTGTPASVVARNTGVGYALDFQLPQGDKGDKGDQGEQGEQGIQGLTGETGPTPTFTVGTVIAAAEPSVTISGTAPDFVLNFELEAGPAGPGSGDVSTESLYANPPWITSLAASKVGLGNVTNESKATMFTNPTFTGTVSGVTATHVGLGNVNNTSDADKPVSTATQTALDLKAPLANPTFTGTVSGVTATHVGLGNVTNESKATMFTNPTFTGTVSGVTAGMVGLGNVTNESKATMFTAPTFTGTTTLQQSTEVLNTKTGATGTVVHDFSTGSIWYHSSISANFTANFTNVPTTENRTISIALILAQGGTAYIPNAVEINGSAASIKWSEGSAPSGTINYTDIVNFILIRTGGSWTVLGSLSTYN